MTLTLILTATVAGLLSVVFWWIRRHNLAVYPAGRAPRELRPLPTGCELGAQLMAASTTEQAPAGGAGARVAGTPSATAPSSTPPRRKKTKLPTRREFLRKAWMGGFGVLGASFAGSSLAFLWPNLRGGFGSQIDVGTQEEILAYIADNREPFPYPSGRMYVVAYDPALDAENAYGEITNGANVMALYQRCVHLGCKVPWCLSAQWFQCPCHGSNYNRWGEWQRGPAARGLDRFSLRIEGGQVVVDTSTIITGPTRTSGVLQQPQEGPNCI